MNPIRVKNDVINELRNKIYFNQLEIQRLLENPSSMPHKMIVDEVINLLKDNVVSDSSIALLEQYLPTQTKKNENPTDDFQSLEGVTKVD